MKAGARVSLTIHRSNRMEWLVESLSQNLLAHTPDDPFTPVPIVVGSRGMERWLSHALATRHGICAGVAFPFPRAALDGAVQSIIGDARPDYWVRAPTDDPWAADTLAWRVVPVLRRLLAEDDPCFAPVRAYLSPEGAPGLDAGAPVQARELAFCREVADVLDRLIRHRPDDAMAWSTDGSAATSAHGWLAAVLRALYVELVDDADDPQPHAAARDRSLRAAMAASPRPTDQAYGRVLHLFGLSTLGGTELDTLDLVAQRMQVHLYLLVPSQAWMKDLLGRTELRAALMRAQTDAEKVAALDRWRGSNPLLGDLGLPSRHVQARLETLPHQYQSGLEAYFDPVAQGHDTVLAHLQSAVLHAHPLPRQADRGPLPTPDQPSLRFWPCHGPLRQVEALRETLLRAMSLDPTLTPRDVLVMTPDVAGIAPLVAAVFGQPLPAETDHDGARAAVRVSPLPVRIADLGLRESNPVAGVLMAVLQLATERLTARALLDLLALPPLRDRFGITTDDLEDVQRILVESGFRWGADAADRAQAGQPPLHQNTLDFCLERVAAGALFLDDAAPLIPTPNPAPGDDGTAEMMAFEAVDRRSIDRFGKLYACCRAILHHRQAVSTPARPAAWRRRLDTLLSDLTTTTDDEAWLRSKVTDSIDALFAGVQVSGFDAPISLPALRSWLDGRFDRPQAGDRPITGAITVCALEPMRSVPFRVVALLGMDDGSFPRMGRRRSWDPLGKGRRLGELERRDTDRHLLLEALLSARDRVDVFWTGFDSRTGEATPPAVPIRELQDVVDRTWKGPKDRSASAALTVQLPLQPWSPQAFTGPSPWGLDRRLRDAATALRHIQRGTRAPLTPSIQPGTLPVPAVPASAATVDATDLARALQRPQALLLRTRFGLRQGQTLSEIPDRAPLSLDSLQRWQVRRDLLTAELAGDTCDVDVMARQWRGAGTLPIGTRGPAAVRAVSAEADHLIDALRTTFGASATWRQVDCAARVLCQGRTVTIGAPDIRLAPTGGGVVAVDASASRASLTAMLGPWVRLLVAAASGAVGPGLRGAATVRRTDAGAATCWLALPADPVAVLGVLVDTWLRAQSAPLPLFPTASVALVDALGTEAPDARGWWDAPTAARRAARRAFISAWEGGQQTPGDHGDSWVQALFQDPDFNEVLPVEDDGDPPGDPPWAHEAIAVWAPLLAAVRVDGLSRGEP